MKKIMSAALLALAVGGVQAQVYVGANVGPSKLNVICTGGAHCDDSSTGFKISVGYADDAVPHGALELGYIGFGSGETRYSASSATYAKVKTHAVYLAGGMHANFFRELGGSFRLGLAGVKTECGYRGATFAPSQTIATAYLGLGLDYAFTKNIKAVLSADLTTAECGPERGGVNLISLGGQYTF